MPDLGPQPDWADPNSIGRCGYNPQPEHSPVGDCGKPPTVHGLLADDHGFVAACAEHSLWMTANLPLQGIHDWGTWCDMPGSLWLPGDAPDGTDSRCVLDGGGEGPVLVGRADRALVGGVTR